MIKVFSIFAAAFVFIGVGVPFAAFADGLRFSFPLDCVIGKTCWIPNYVDLKPGKGVLDYACGKASYDAPPGAQHKGTDIAVTDMAAVRDGVPVLAAAPGVVIGQRDGIQDINIKDNPKGIASTMACGNGLRIQHDNGMISQYCHMRKNSVVAWKGDKVKRGQVIGMVGLSGKTSYPHLHFQVTMGKKILDPFAGLDRTQKCGVGQNPLWDDKTIAMIPYQPTAIFNAGFSNQRPDFKAIRAGLYKGNKFAAKVPALVVWAEFFRVKANDRITFIIIDPHGRKIHEKTIAIKADKARYIAFSGLRLKQPSWPLGTYVGKINLVRAGKIISTIRKIDML